MSTTYYVGRKFIFAPFLLAVPSVDLGFAFFRVSESEISGLFEMSITLLAIASLAIDPAVENYLKYALYDYESAKIEVLLPARDVPARIDGRKPSAKRPADTTAQIHCVRINAKNRLGGYTGWSRSMMVSVNGKVRFYTDDTRNALYIDEECPGTERSSY